MDYSSLGLSLLGISATFTVMKLVQDELNRLAATYHLKK